MVWKQLVTLVVGKYVGGISYVASGWKIVPTCTHRAGFQHKTHKPGHQPIPPHSHASLQLTLMQLYLRCLTGTSRWPGQERSVSLENNGHMVWEASKD